jgi:acyl carrier protein
MPSTDIAPKVVEEAIYDAAARLGADRSGLTRDATFEQLDLDSLDVVEIAQMAQEEWGAKLEPQDLNDVETIGEAIDLVIARLP